MVHLHGFGLSGRYLLPTAERLSDEFHTFVPDLPGFGLSWRAPRALDMPGLAHAAAAFLDDRGMERATLVGNSMGVRHVRSRTSTPSGSSARSSCRRPAGGSTSRCSAP